MGFFSFCFEGTILSQIDVQVREKGEGEKGKKERKSEGGREILKGRREEKKKKEKFEL